MRLRVRGRVWWAAATGCLCTALSACGGSVVDGAGSGELTGAEPAERDASAGGASSGITHGPQTAGAPASGGPVGNVSTGAGGGTSVGDALRVGSGGYAVIATGGVSGVAGGATTGTGGAMVIACNGSTPRLAWDGTLTGFEYCGQQLHRVFETTCTQPPPMTCEPVDAAADLPPLDATSPDDPDWEPCRTNADCDRHSGGMCSSCYCQYTCITDTDCAPGEVCACGSSRNHCMHAYCRTDADCPGGLCALHKDTCGRDVLACGEGDYPCTFDSGTPY